MSSAPDDPLDAALMLARAFDAEDVPYAIGGALAFGIWAIPRATLDLDINVFVESDAVPDLVQLLTDLGLTLHADEAAKDARDRGMFQAYWGDLRVDVFTPSIPFDWEAMRTRRVHAVEGHNICFLSPEALSVFKMLFFRSKDLVDLERLLAVQGDKLDWRYVREHLVEMMGEDDPRVVEWDALAAIPG